MLNNADFDILYLNETDTKQILSSSDYQIKGYETILPKISPINKTVRIILLYLSGLNLMEGKLTIEQ